MVLAAGLGMRMRPLTHFRPKPALPVLNRPIAAHVLEHLASHGVTNVVMNSHHMSDALEEAVAREKPGSMDVIISHEPRILGTAGGLRKASKHFEGEPFYMINADGITNVDLSAAADAHALAGHRATMIVQDHDPESGYRPVMESGTRGGTGKVVGLAGRRWGESEGTPRTFIGIHVIEPGIMDRISTREPCDINADIYPALLDEDKEAVGTWRHDGWWFEAGSPGRYLDLNLSMLSRTASTAVVGPGFFIDDDARVERSVIGSSARLERDVEVMESVLWERVYLAPGASLHRCIVTDDVSLPAGKKLTESIVIVGEDGDLSVSPLRPAS
jgi:mannose-1-phosphate guanylyltransferase